MIFIMLLLSPITCGVDYLHINIEGKERQTKKSLRKIVLHKTLFTLQYYANRNVNESEKEMNDLSN